jgi:hypothetical protein
MPLQQRSFQTGPDPYGAIWQVDFAWLQTATSIRHADAVDVKFFITQGDTKLERVVSLPHPALLELSSALERPLTDPWCTKLAALHIRHMIETGEDIEKTLITVAPAALQQYGRELGAD